MLIIDSWRTECTQANERDECALAASRVWDASRRHAACARVHCLSPEDHHAEAEQWRNGEWSGRDERERQKQFVERQE